MACGLCRSTDKSSMAAGSSLGCFPNALHDFLVACVRLDPSSSIVVFLGRGQCGMPKDIRDDADMLGVLDRYCCRRDVAKRVGSQRLAKLPKSECRKMALKTRIRERVTVSCDPEALA